MDLRSISMRQVAIRLRNRGYVGSGPSWGLSEGDPQFQNLIKGLDL